MVAGETILKLTDFPFSYSIIGILSGVLGFGISDNYLIFLGVAGAFGTFLTITDPIGWLLRKNEEDRIKKGYDVKHNPELTLEKQFKISALRTKSITFEFKKIIGLFYFIIILFFFLAATIPPDALLFEKLIIKNNDGEALCDILCFKISYLSISSAALIILVIKANRFWKDLDKKIEIAGFHQIAINNDNATQTSVENMTRAVEQNDWALAKIWQGKIEEEIKYKKGKRELIIKAADMVVSPLHFEASEFQKYLQNRTIDPFREFNTAEWTKIKQNSLQSIVEDTNLRRRIESFYNTLNDYNKIVPKLFSEMNKIINKNFSEVFNKNVSGVEFYLDLPNSGNTVHLQTCALFEINPMEFDHPPREFGSFRLRIQNGDQIRDAQYTKLNDFDKVWQLVLEDVKNNNMIIKIKKYLAELEINNNKLMKIYSEKIGMQRNV